MILLLTFFLGLPANADTEQNATKAAVIYAKMGAAFEALDSASVDHRTERFGAGAANGVIEVARITVVRDPQSEEFPFRLFMEGQVTGGHDQDAESYQILVDGENVRLLDRFHKQATSPDPDQIGDFLTTTRINGNPLLMGMLFPVSAGKDTMLSLEGTAIVDGQLCDVVYREQGEGIFISRKRFYIARSDSLPRRVESHYKAENDRPAMTLHSLTNLRTSIKSKPSIFTSKTPADYSISHYQPKHWPREVGVGEIAPAWELTDARGEVYQLIDFRGKVLVFDIWGIWCKPCLERMPKMQELHRQYGSDVIVIGINTDRVPKKAQRWIAEQNFTYLQLYGAESLRESYGIRTFPTLMILDEKGKIIHRQPTRQSSEQSLTLEQKLKQYLDKNH